MHIRTVLFAGLSALALATAAAAQDDPVQADESEEMEIVLSEPVARDYVRSGSGFSAYKAFTTAHVSVIMREDLVQEPSGGIGDTLADLPGIRASGLAVGAGRPVIRGLDGFRVLVLNNGLGAVDASSLSPVYAVATSPTEAYRIEVLRGASVLAYGGNASGGIVNIFDDRIANPPGVEGWVGSVTAEGSTADRGLQGSLKLSTGSGPWGFTLDAFKRTSDDYDTPVAPSLTPGDSRYRQGNSAMDMRTIGAGVNYRGDIGSGGISYKSTDYTYGVAVNDAIEVDLHQARWEARGEVEVDLAGFHALKLAASSTDYHHAEIEDGEISTQVFSSGSEFRATLVRASNSDTNGALGVSGFNRQLQAVGAGAFFPSSTTSQVALFTQYRSPISSDSWSFEGGARVDRTSIRARDVTGQVSGGFDRDFDAVSASAGLFYRFGTTGFIGMNLNRAERAPSEVELLADGARLGMGDHVVGDAGLRTEIGTSMELSGKWYSHRGRQLGVEAYVYASRFDRFIDLRPTGESEDGLPVFRYVQTGADLRGFEVRASTQAFSWGDQWLRLEAAYDYVDGEADLGPVVRLPPSALSVKLTSTWEDWSSHVEVRAVADRNKDLAAFETATDGYVAVNLFTSYKVSWWKSRFYGAVLYAEIRNLTDAEMREATSPAKDLVVAPGRSLRAGLMWNF